VHSVLPFGCLCSGAMADDISDDALAIVDRTMVAIQVWIHDASNNTAQFGLLVEDQVVNRCACITTTANFKFYVLLQPPHKVSLKGTHVSSALRQFTQDTSSTFKSGTEALTTATEAYLRIVDALQAENCISKRRGREQQTDDLEVAQHHTLKRERGKEAALQQREDQEEDNDPVDNETMLKKAFFADNSSRESRMEALQAFLGDTESVTVKSSAVNWNFDRQTDDWGVFFDGIQLIFPKRQMKASRQWASLLALRNDKNTHWFGNKYPLLFATYSDYDLCWEAVEERLMDGVNLNVEHPEAPELRKLFSTKRNLLPIIAGESGSGKTHLMLSCNKDAVTVYVSGISQALQEAAKVLAAQVREGVTPPGDGGWVSNMAQFIADTVLQGRAPPKKGWTLDLIVSFDEMAHEKITLHLLCRFRSAIVNEVMRRCQADSVHMVAAGTGVDTVAGGPGSLPDSYKLLELVPNAFVWDAFVTEKRSKMLRDTLTLISDQLQGLVGNPRAAVLLASLTRSIIAKYTVEETYCTVLRSGVDALLTQVSSEYRAMNGMSNLSDDKVREACTDAFRAVHCDAAKIEEPRLFFLVSKCGLITDYRRNPNATVRADLLAKGWKESPAIDKEGTTTITTPYVIPPEGRYAMSPAIGLMMLSQFGVLKTNFNSGASGEALEELVAAKIALAFAMTNNLTEALQALKITVRHTREIVFSTDEDVIKLRLNHRISKGINPKSGKENLVPATAKTEIDNIEKELLTARAVVVINARCAPYADIIVAVKGWLGLFQCKDEQEGASIPFEPELRKCHLLKDRKSTKQQNVTTHLRTITNTPLGVGPYPDFVFVVSNDQSSRKPLPKTAAAVERVHVMDCKSGFLKPFLWPRKTAYLSREVVKVSKTRAG
jgi:hypothetical protein